MGGLSNAVRILLTLPDPPPDREVALIDAVSLIIAQSLLPAAGIGALSGASAQEQNAASDAAKRLTGGLLSRELISEAQSDALQMRVSEHLAGGRPLHHAMQHPAERKNAAVVCGVIGAVMAATSKDSRSLVEDTPPFGNVEYRAASQKQGNGKGSSLTIAASNAPDSAVRYGGITTVKGSDGSISGNATYGVTNGSQTLSFSSQNGSSSAKVSFTEADTGILREASREDDDSVGDAGTSGEANDVGAEAGDAGDITSGVSVVVDEDSISYISTVTDNEGNTTIVSVTEFLGTGAWTLTITSVDSSGAGTSTVINGDANGNITEQTISNIQEGTATVTTGSGTTGSGAVLEGSQVDTSLTEDIGDPGVTELTGVEGGDE